MSTNLLQPHHLSQLVTTKTALNDLDLALTLSQQIVLKNDQKFPDKTQFGAISYGQVSVIEALWTTAQSLEPSITWETFIETLKTLVSEAQKHVVTLAIAYQPTVKQVEELSDLIKTQVHEAAILDLSYEPELLAGCQIASNGQKLDYSLATWLPPYIERQLKS